MPTGILIVLSGLPGVGKTAVARQLARRAGAVLGREPDTPVLVKADERVPYGSVVRGMVLLQQAGATKIGFLTDPKAVRALEELERKR